MCMEHEDRHRSQASRYAGRVSLPLIVHWITLRETSRGEGLKVELPPRVLAQDIPATEQFIKCMVSPGTLLKAAVSRVKNTEEQDGPSKMALRIKAFAAKPD